MTPVGALLTAIGLLAALVAARGVAPAARRGGAAAQLRHLFRQIALLLGLRLVLTQWESPLVMALIMVVAAWMPLATLRLGEELVRRHAPRPLKLAALGGAIGFSVLAATFGLVWTHQAVLALAAFQILVVGAVVVHIYTQRASVSLLERRAVDLLALALLLAVPLLATDFQRLFPDLPVRGGALAALIFVLACTRLLGEGGRPLALLGDIAVAAGAAGIGAAAAHLAGAQGQSAILVSVSTGALAALLLLIERFDTAGRTGEGILPALAKAGSARAEILSAHPLLSGAARLGEAELADLPAGAAEQLAESRVIRLDGLSGSDTASGAARELLDRHSATHLLRLSRQPPAFLAISGGALAGERLNHELEIAARLLERAE